MADKIRIDVNHLQVGMTVVELDKPWIDTPFLLQGFTIGSRADIKALQEHCRFVYVDPTASDVQPKPNQKPEADAPGYFNKLYGGREKAPVSIAVEKELPEAKRIHRQANQLVKTCMDDIVLGNAINEEVLKQNVSEIVESIVRNPDAMIWLSRLKHKDHQASQHSLNCCILSVAFGRYLSLPTNELEKLAIGALMHDVGKLQIPTEILNKPSSLSPEEQTIIQSHPTASRNLLMSAGSYFAPAVDIAYSHHERINGSGYPRGVKGHALSPFSRMVAIIDIYDAMTTEQVYREELAPFDALKHLNQNKGESLDAQLVTLFIKMIGVFPVGSLIELTTGEIGIVITSNRDDNLRPKVLLMLNSDKSQMPREIINLARKPVDSLGRDIKIAKTLRQGDYGLDQKQLIAEGIEFTVLN